MRVDSNNGNSYNYDRETKSFTYLHPLLLELDKMDINGETLSLEILRKRFPEYTVKDIVYYTKKFYFLKNKIRKNIDFANQHTLRIAPKKISLQLANLQQVVFEVTDACNLNTKFFKKWFSAEEYKYFNCDRQPIDLHVICNELASDGRKVFHPFFEIFDLSNIPKSK